MKTFKHMTAGSIGVLAAVAAVFVTAPMLAGAVTATVAQSGADLEGLLRPDGGRGAKPSEAGLSGARPLRPAAGGPAAGGPNGQEVGDAQRFEESFRLRLGQSDLDQRESAFEDIVLRAGLNLDARAALKEIAADTGDPDLAFTARLALREIDRSRRTLSGTYGHGAADPFEAMQRRMNELFANDPFMTDFFSADPFAGDPFFGGGQGGVFRRRPSLFHPPGQKHLTEETQQRIAELRRQIEQLQSAPQGLAPEDPGVQRFSTRRSSSVSVERTADGVRVVVVEDDGTGPKERVYQAPSMEALLEANPELKGRVR